MSARRRGSVVVAALCALGILAGCHGHDERSDVPQGGPDVPIAGQRAARDAEDSADAERTVDRTVEAEADPDAVAITNAEGSIVLGLRNDTVYMRLSDSVLAKAGKHLDSTHAEGGLGGWIEKTVKGTVKQALSQRVAYELDEIEDVRYTDGTIRFRYRDKHALSFEDLKTDHRPVLASFAPDDARRFVAAVREAKRGS